MENILRNKFRVLGIMSGTSLDGLDIALCEFTEAEKIYSYEIIKATTINYTAEWKNLLANIKTSSAENYFKLDSLYGNFIAEEITKFLLENALTTHAIASHGHTVFHQPTLGFSTQIGNGATIAAKTNITTICDFRSMDVANGGQGAPLVPIGDKLLFGNYEACLNIGGIANISFDTKNGDRIAYDICEANMLLNYLTEKINLPFDENGKIAKTGKVNLELLWSLNNLSYYSQEGVKSIGREWFELNCLNLIDNIQLTTEDLLATATEHIAQIIANDLNKHTIKTCLITGGGSFNAHLIDVIKAKTSSTLIIPTVEIINFKEALIFAFLGYLRLHREVNTLKSVTGAFNNSVGGAVYIGNTNNTLYNHEFIVPPRKTIVF